MSSRNARVALSFAGLGALGLLLGSCQPESPADAAPPTATLTAQVPTPEYTLGAENTHNRWSAAIPPALTVPSGAVGLKGLPPAIKDFQHFYFLDPWTCIYDEFVINAISIWCERIWNKNLPVFNDL